MSNPIEYTLVPDLQKLGWLAKIDHANKVSVWHGPKVECHPQWMVEGVWDGEFESGNFHNSIAFFGSGIRIDHNKIYISTSHSNQTRIIYCVTKNGILISNSLVLMLAFTDAKIDEKHDYERECTGILKGTKSYDRRYRVIHPDIDWFYQVFYENVIVSDGRISFEPRLSFQQFTSYEEYVGKLKAILSRIRDNYQSPARQHAVSTFTTLSSGYDSTAITCLVKDIGVKDCYTCKKSNSMLPGFLEHSNDDGTHIANKLGMTVRYLDPNPKHVPEEDELFLIARGARAHMGNVINESMLHTMMKHIETQCDVGVVFRGDHGDSVWETDRHHLSLTDDIVRPSECGSSSIEIRLKSGVIPVAVPYILAENVNSIYAITLSDEMKPWRLFNDYDRPIARRIIETSGIERGMFARLKKGMITHYLYPSNHRLRKQYRSFLKRRHDVGRLFISFYLISNAAVVAGRRIRRFVLGTSFRNTDEIFFFKNFDMAFIMWTWATETLAAKYKRVFQTPATDNR